LRWYSAAPRRRKQTCDGFLLLGQRNNLVQPVNFWGGSIELSHETDRFTEEFLAGV
jgi:hypothetical protein